MKERISKILTHNWPVIVLFAITSFIAYSNSFNVPFQFDDEAQLLFNKHNQNITTFSDFKMWTNVNYRPLATFSLAFNYNLGGENVYGYHLFNYLVHLLASILFYLLLKLLIKYRKEPLSAFFPIVAALFFLLHPVQTQSVTYIVQRMTSMAGLFSLMAVYAYTAGRYKLLIDKKKIVSIGFMSLAVLSSVLGILSKQTAVILPLLFVAVEWIFVRDDEGKVRKPWAWTISIGTVMLFVVPILLYGLPAETIDISRLNYLATQMTVIPRYLQMMLVPVGLYIDHGVVPVTTLFDLKVIGGALLLFVLLIFAFIKAHKWPFLSFGILWIYITLLVESSVIPIRDVMFDHRMYLPLAGFSVALWWFVFYALKNKQQYATIISIVVIILFGTATYHRNQTWRDSTALWEEVTQRYPNHLRAWLSVGRSLAAAGSTDYAKIIESYKKALQIDPNCEDLWNDIGTNYIKAGEIDQAMQCFQKLENSNNLEYRVIANRTLGVFSLSNNNFDEAEKHLVKALDIAPQDSTVLHGLSSLYIKTKQWDKALEYAEAYLNYSPHNPDLLINAAYAAFNMSRFEKATNHLNRLLEKEPDNVTALVMQANTMSNLRRFNEAVDLLEKAYRLSNNQEYIDAANRLRSF